MSTISFTTAISKLDDRMLRDIGVATDGSVIAERDPRFRRVARPAGAIDRLLNLPLAGMLFRT